MDAPARVGEVLAGKYLVERVLGKGGMGVVVAARHLHLDHMVALKFLLAEAGVNAEARSRFLREARNAVRLQSEHVARILDVGALDDGTPYIVIEYLQGSDLSVVLAQHGPMSVTVAVECVLQACDAIAEAHSLGIIHRDLKPQNLFMTRRRDNATVVKVLDFGISKSLFGDDFTATQTGSALGTPAYMAPEQMRSSKHVSPATDVWALGIILYELVVGSVPWQGETYPEICLKVSMDPLPTLPRALQQNRFDAVLRRCLERSPPSHPKRGSIGGRALALCAGAGTARRAHHPHTAEAGKRGSGAVAASRERGGHTARGGVATGHRQKPRLTLALDTGPRHTRPGWRHRDDRDTPQPA
ncbi:MAG: serine/threonine protein kinase [Myxococcales bacterium]|nr:serine/threonine protein kinase [Myxococcales bacterium]